MTNFMKYLEENNLVESFTSYINTPEQAHCEKCGQATKGWDFIDGMCLTCFRKKQEDQLRKFFPDLTAHELFCLSQSDRDDLIDLITEEQQ